MCWANGLIVLSFYSTYEELKLSPFNRIFFFYYLGFYSTYEELKHDNDKPCEKLILRFYSTYEELKRKRF